MVIILFIGLILLFMVDVEAGHADARAEDKRLREIQASLNSEGTIDE